MTEVQAKDVGTGKEECFDHFEGIRGRAKCRELLGSLAPSLSELGNGGNRRFLLEWFGCDDVLRGGSGRLDSRGGKSRATRDMNGRCLAGRKSIDRVAA